MDFVEVFAGTKSFSEVAKIRGHTAWTTDLDERHHHDHYGNILDHETQRAIFDQVKKSHAVWISLPCTKWSLAAGNKNWTEYRMPRNQETIEAMMMVMYARFLADYCANKNKIFVIENPNGRMVWMADNQYLKRVWYCQYGDTRAKPTSLWTNIPDWTPKTCFNGNPNCDHERAPRGSKTGTQGLKNNHDRSIVPELLCQEVVERIERFFSKNKGNPTLL